MHTYSIAEENPADHTEEDMTAIDNFVQYLSVCDLENPETVNQFLGSDQNAREIVLPRLVRLQDTLFKQMRLMTKKMLRACFEPCMRVALLNAFHLQGVKQNAQDISPLVNGAELISDTGEQKKGHVFADNKTTTTLCRIFQTTQEFTQFVRALILITNEGGLQEFQLPQGIIRSPLVSVNSPDPKPRLQLGKLQAPLKASVRLLEEALVDNDAAYMVENKNYLVTESPILASFYFG